MKIPSTCVEIWKNIYFTCEQFEQDSVNKNFTQIVVNLTNLKNCQFDQSIEKSFFMMFYAAA